MSHYRQVSFKAISILIGFLIGLTMCELILRLCPSPWLSQRMRELNPGKSDIIQFGSDRSWYVIKEGKEIRNFIPFSHLRMIHYEYNKVAHIDKWGGRRTYTSDAFQGDTPVPFLGDSVAFGIGVEDFETYVSLLGEKLKVCTLNLGVPGADLKNAVFIIRNRHKELNSPPVYIISLCCGNDILFDNKAEDAKGGNISMFEKESTKFSQLLESINAYVYHSRVFKKIYVIQFVRKCILDLFYRWTGKRQMYPIFITMDKKKIDYVEENVRKGFDLELSRLALLCKEMNFKTIFILIPDKYQVSEKLLASKIKYYSLEAASVEAELPNKIIRAELKKYNFNYIDTINFLKNRNDIDSLYYIQDDHLTAAGHRAIADAVYPELKELFYDLGISKRKEVN